MLCSLLCFHVLLDPPRFLTPSCVCAHILGAGLCARDPLHDEAAREAVRQLPGCAL